MKKKILSILIAICFIVPCMIILSACGPEKDSKDNTRTTVTAAEWFTAITFESTLTKYQTEINIQGRGKISYIVDGDIINKSNSETENEYYSKEADKYYKYTAVLATWTKTEIEESEYNRQVSTTGLGDLSAISYASATYNETEKCYDVVVDIPGMTNVKFYFENGTLTKITYTITEGNCEVKIGYENFDLTLPTV